MTINPSLILLFALTFALPVNAEIYQWTDADGKSHFSASKPAQPASLESRKDLEVKSPRPAPVNDKVDVDNKAQATAPQVDLYVTSWCPYCKKAMAFLRKNNIAFNSYDIEQDPEAAARKKDIDPGYSGIPLAVINGTAIRGFSESSYQQALAK
jgi:glutaredoxin